MPTRAVLLKEDGQTKLLTQIVTDAIEAGGGGGAAVNKATVVVDFGATPTDRASLAVTGQTWVVAATSSIRAFLMADSHAENGVDAHILGSQLISFSVGSLIDGTGFTIYAVCESLASGKFTVRWEGI